MPVKPYTLRLWHGHGRDCDSCAGMTEIKRDELHCLRVLGKGQFGEVFLATWSAQSEYVAVKIAQGHVSLEDASEFLGEAELMAPYCPVHAQTYDAA